MSPKIITKKPFWWFITGKPWGSVAMAFGDTIYCSKDKLTDEIIAHEKVHLRQHKYSKLYATYILIKCTFNNKFYEELEREAYREQLRFRLSRQK